MNSGSHLEAVYLEVMILEQEMSCDCAAGHDF